MQAPRTTMRASAGGMRVRSTPRPDPEPEPEPEPGPPATGVVNVVTPGGWAEIWWRGRRVGQTPGRVTIASGRQRLEIRPFGRTPGRPVSVEVPADGTTRVSVDLR
jgi:hypothetical protein